MASEEAGGPTNHDQRESWIDDFIRDVLNEGGKSTQARGHGDDYITTLVEKAIASAPDAADRASTIEKLLLAQALATALADALAPALAELVAPEIMKALERHVDNGHAGQVMASASGRAKSNRRKT
jgi:hypothetical protein